MANWFVRSRPTTQWVANTSKSLGNRVIATSSTAYLGIHFECTTAGTTHLTTEPTWNTTIGGTTTDNTVTWTTRGSANVWAASASYALGDRVHSTLSATGARQTYIYECTTAGTSGGSEPAWVTTTPDSSTTTDNTVTWTLRKPTTWDNAHPYLTRIDNDNSGTGKLNAGDTVYVSANHSESNSSSITFSTLGTGLNPIVVICVEDVGDPSSPTTTATTAVVETTGGSNITLVSGFVIYGIKFYASETGYSGTIYLGATISSSNKLVNCYLKIRSSTVSSVGVFASTATSGRIILINTPIEFTNSGHTLTLDGGWFEWRNTAPAFIGTVPNPAITLGNAGDGYAWLDNLDLSSISGTLFNSASANTASEVYLNNCRLHSSVTLNDGVHADTEALTIRFTNCNSGAVNYSYYHVTEHGDISSETTLVMTSGATDGTTPISRKIVTNTYPTFSIPLTTLPIILWNESIGSSITATIEILHDSATALKNDEIWVELSYLGSSSYPLGTVISDSKTDILATGADQATSTANWTTTGMSNPNTQKLEVTFTPNMKGLIMAVVCVAKASKTVYINPEIRLS